MIGRGRSRRRLLAWVVLVLVAAPGCGDEPETPPPTARVDRGDVIQSVKASGSIVAVGEQKLGFPDSGKITEVLVKVGDRVEPGQVLARLDDFALRQTLAQRQATLDEQQAVLGRVTGDPSVGGAEAAVRAARDVEEATEDEVSATDEANSSASERARAQLKVEQDARDLAQSQLRAARSACAASAAAPGTATGGATTCDTSAAESAVQQADAAVVGAKSQVIAAENQEDTDAAAGRVSIENARQGVVSAQNELDSARSDRPFNVAEQRALVDDARAGLAGARRDVDEAVLTAPVAGVVAAINGVPGEFVAAPSVVTAQGPGGTPLPPVNDISGGSGNSGGGDEAPGAGAFLVLAAANAFEVVVPFEETDAVKLIVGQQVDITVDALINAADPEAGPTFQGRVLAIAPTGQSVGGIVSFYTTISIENPDQRLRSGMTADAGVRTQVTPNVLRVPTSAVGRTDGRPSVTITGPDGDPETVPFEPGLVGDDHTEVRSGLRPGQDVRLPQATVTPPPNPPQGGPGG